MAERRVIITSQHGLHARPAALFTQAAASSGLAISLTKDGKTVKASSILGVISLGVDRNDEVTLSAEGANAEQILDDLVTLLSTDFDRPDAASSITPVPGATPVPGTVPVPGATPVPGTPAAPIPAPSIADTPAPPPSIPDAPVPIPPPY